MEVIVTLTQPGLIYLNFVRQGKGPREILENLAGSCDYCTGDIVCRFPMKRTGQMYIFPLKIFQKGDCWDCIQGGH